MSLKCFLSWSNILQSNLVGVVWHGKTRFQKLFQQLTHSKGGGGRPRCCVGRSLQDCYQLLFQFQMSKEKVRLLFHMKVQSCLTLTSLTFLLGAVPNLPNPSLCSHTMVHSLDLDKIQTSSPMSSNGAVCVLSQIHQNPAKLGRGFGWICGS